MALAGTLFGQTSTGTISGHVADPTGAAVPGAEVRIQNEVIKDFRTFNTDHDGNFTFPGLQPGTYTVTVKAAGFKQYEKTGLILNGNDELAAGEMRLQIGATSDTVEVKADVDVVQSQSADRTAVLNSTDVGELAARGRDVMAMLQILPGVINDNTGSDVLGQFTTPTMNGTRANYNALNVDGISGNTARGSNAQSPINLDSIEQVTVLTSSYTAEYGTAGGAVINLVTKWGTQTYHGGVYYYVRNEDFNANNFFNNKAGRNAEGDLVTPRPRYRYNTTGVFLSGPIYIPKHFNTAKQKLFFFFSEEYDPNTTPNATGDFTVPSALERQGDFSQSYKNATTLYSVKDPLSGAPFPGNVIPQSRFDPNSSKLLTVFPLPNYSMAASNYAYNLIVPSSDQQPVLTETLRVDYNASDKIRMTFKASGYSSSNSGLNSAAIDNKWGPASVNYKQTMPQLGTTMTYVFSPTLVNELTVGMNLWTEDQLLSKSGLAAYQRSTYGINIPQTYPADNPLGLLPAFSFSSITGSAAITYDGRFPMVDDSTAYSAADNLSKVWGRHLIKGGLLYEHILYNQYHQAGGNSFPGNFVFGTNSSMTNDTGYGYANALLGNYYTYTEATNRVDYAPVTLVEEGYIQDKWQAMQHLTFDIGLRISNALAQQPNNNEAGNFVAATYNPAQATVLFRPEVVNGAKVIVNPLTGAVVPNTYSGLIVPNSGNPLNGIITPTTPGYPSSMVYNNGIIFAPRFGMAWSPTPKTAVRLGGGIFYAGHPDAGTLGNLFFNPPAIYTPTAYNGTVATAANSTGLLSPSAFSRDIDPHGKVVTVYQYNFEVQRDIGFGTIVHAAYVGSLGRHLGENYSNINEVPYGAEFLPQNQNPQSATATTGSPLNDNYFRPYPGYGTIPLQVFNGNSSYHSLQLQADRRFAKGLQFGAVYTFSKAMDYCEGDSTTCGGVALYLNQKVWNYGLAGYDRPNVLTFHFYYQIPKLSQYLPNPVVKALFDGWQLADITSFISGQMMSVTMGESPSLNITGGGDGARPLMVGNPSNVPGGRNVNEWFNQNAYAEPTPLGTNGLCPAAGCPPITIANIGDAPANQFRGPGVNNWNTYLYKTFNIAKEGRVMGTFRFEAYNTFNHTQFSTVDTTITYNAAGVNTRATTGNVTAARDPRYLQMALRITF
jgi:hypothetical protein